MLGRLGSLRLWLVAAMTVAAVTGLVAARFVIAGIEKRDELAKDRRKAELVAASIAAQVGAGATPARLQIMQSVLPNSQIVVYRGNKLVFASSPRHHDGLELTVTNPVPGGGRVLLRDYESPGGTPGPWALILVTAGVVLLVILAAAGTATVVVAAVRRPVERAVTAARRVAGGDFTARIGAGGPEELVELGRSFDEMAARLEAADRDQRRFLADVAHEIATPLNVIAGYALALADRDLQDPQELHEASEVIRNETERLRSLLDSLRQLTQLDLAAPGPIQQVDVAELLRRVETRFAPVARQARVALQVRGSGTAESDARLLETVLDNLLSNALRYTPAGGKVTLTSHRRRHEIVISVKDTGIGIDPAEQRRVFDRLYRVDEARDRERGGSGIGLALAQRAARALSGRIELQSTPGRGSDFRLVIPRTTAQSHKGAMHSARTATEAE